MKRFLEPEVTVVKITTEDVTIIGGNLNTSFIPDAGDGDVILP